MIKNAFITISNQRVGSIDRDADNGLGTFKYDSYFLKNNFNLSPIKMPIQGAEKRFFIFRELRDINTFKGLPGLLADVLPDKYGNSLINTCLTRHGIPSDSLNQVEMLCFITGMPEVREVKLVFRNKF